MASDEKVTRVKTNGQVTRETMASGNPNQRARNNRPRVHSPAGIKHRAELRAKHHAASGPREMKFDKGYNEPGSLNPRKVGR